MRHRAPPPGKFPTLAKVSGSIPLGAGAAMELGTFTSPFEARLFTLRRAGRLSTRIRLGTDDGGKGETP